MTHTWDPDRYLWYADERARPFLDLIGRIRATDPESVVDLGCGPGNLTAILARRWPQARVVGVDASPEMIERARADHGTSARFSVGDLREWAPEEPVDVLVSNATLQWVPGHLDVLTRLVATVAPAGWIAFQVPGNFSEPSHTIRAQLAAEEPYAAYTAQVAVPESEGPLAYLIALTALGCEVDAWETTYLHVLRGPDPVFEWVCGTGAGPTLQALPEPLRSAFTDEFKRRLRGAYPPESNGTVLPFRRVFVVARRT